MGPAGPAGSSGGRGERGERGERGQRGERGEVGPSGQPGLPGPRGERGERGQRGERGERGETGPRGERGETVGTIIPIASGRNTPLVLQTSANGDRHNVSVLAFGNASSFFAPVDPIVITEYREDAFVMPRDGVVRGMRLHLTAASCATLCGNSEYKVVCQLYTAPSSSNSFEPLSGTRFELVPELTGNVAIGQKLNGGFDVHHVEVDKGEQILTVVYIEGDNHAADAVTILAYASGGIDIA